MHALATHQPCDKKESGRNNETKTSLFLQMTVSNGVCLCSYILQGCMFIIRILVKQSEFYQKAWRGEGGPQANGYNLLCWGLEGSAAPVAKTRRPHNHDAAAPLIRPCMTQSMSTQPICHMPRHLQMMHTTLSQPRQNLCEEILCLTRTCTLYSSQGSC